MLRPTLCCALSAFFVVFLCNPFSASSDTLVQDPSKDNSQECTCYLTAGPSLGYFQYHRFWDFRSVSSDGANDFTRPPPALSDADELATAPPTSSYLSTSDFVTNWSIQKWTADADSLSPVRRVNSAQNIYISRNTTTTTQPGNGAAPNTYLTLRASRLDDLMSTAELASNQLNLLHSSIRARLRIIPNYLLNTTSAPTPASSSSSPGANDTQLDLVSPGAVAAMFTYESSQSESDLEVLTRDQPPTSIHYSNQPGYFAENDTTVPGASTKATLPRNKAYTDWLDHRVDWFDGVSRWYVDGELVVEKELNVPKEPSGLILNLWGDGGEWSGNMSVGAQVVLGVEWIEMVFNTSGPVEGPPPPPQQETAAASPGGKDSKRDLVHVSSHGQSPRLNLWKRDSSDTCNVGCSIDGVKQVGFPEVAFSSSSPRTFMVGAPSRAVVMPFLALITIIT